MNRVIVWFRRDLRLHHNPALHWANQHGDSILPVYIYAPDEEAPWQPGGATRWWLQQSLIQLETELKKLGLQLQYFSGDSLAILQQLVQQTGASTLVFNKLYEPHLIKRDNKIINTLTQSHITTKNFDNGLFFKPGQILNNQQLPYRVYTPFAKKVRSVLSQHDIQPLAVPDLGSPCMVDVSTTRIDDLKITDTMSWHSKFHHYWQPGEQQAWQRLNAFMEQSLQAYDQQRDYPASDGTSALSAHLHFGEITVEQIYVSLLPLLASDQGEHTRISAERFLNQLIWREFAHHILWHYPHTATQSMDSRYSDHFWHTDKKIFQQWTRGETGIPIIDAGMKQLWETGWMHNRVRMITASFLTKNLGCHWRDGARWFWDTLVDASLANNSMGWQWVAGCGVDAAPYYRIFNPLTQTRRFDTEQEYIKHWAPAALQSNYYSPMIDLDASRREALDKHQSFISATNMIHPEFT